MAREWIKVDFVYPPIPTRQFDWAAVSDNYEGGDPIGCGPTREEAINDLMDNHCKERTGEVDVNNGCRICLACVGEICRVKPRVAAPSEKE